MEDQLKKALDFSNYRQTFSIQRKTLKEKIDAKLTYGVNGGIFKIDRSLISFVQMLVDLGRSKDVPLLDINDNPIVIPDLESFRDEINLGSALTVFLWPKCKLTMLPFLISFRQVSIICCGFGS